MRDKSQQLRKRPAKKSKRGFRGFPLATIAACGTDDQRATKLVISIGGEDEAVSFAHHAGPTWRQTQGALGWLEHTVGKL